MSDQTSIPADPELDPTASYATDQSVIRRLSGLLRATAGTRTSYAPATGQPIADLPVSSADDVRVPAVARNRPDNRRITDWSVAYEAVGSSSGSAGIDVWSLIREGYLPVIAAVSIRGPLS